jgi:hypothetical protein
MIGSISSRIKLIAGGVVLAAAFSGASGAAAAMSPVAYNCANGECVVTVSEYPTVDQVTAGKAGTSAIAVLLLPDLFGVVSDGFTAMNVNVGKTASIDQFTVAFLGQDGIVDQEINAGSGSGVLTLTGSAEEFNLGNGISAGAVFGVDHSITVGGASACAFEPLLFACAGAGGVFTPSSYATGIDAYPPVGPGIAATVTWSRGHPVRIVTSPAL